jgi:hypothetical protein
LKHALIGFDPFGGVIRGRIQIELYELSRWLAVVGKILIYL